MKTRSIIVLAAVVAFAVSARAQQLSPREIWSQATSAASNDDIDSAVKRTNELLDTGKSYGLKTYPVYAASAAAMARQAQKSGDPDVAQWAAKTADQLDPKSPAVAFSNADFARDRKNWGRAIPAAFSGFARIFADYKSRLLSQADLLIVGVIAFAITAALFAVSLFIRYGRAMAHDFREMLAQRIQGGSVSVLAFALLFLPFFLWLGPVWLLLYWLVLFFGYANVTERIFTVVLLLVFLTLPIVGDRNAVLIAGVENPIVKAAVSTNEQSYQPEALRRLQDLATIVPENATVQLLLGNLQLFEGNEAQAAVHYRRSAELKDSAGVHVNLGNLHFLNNDFAASITEYEKAQGLDANLAIAFYNHSVASGEMYRFDEQGQKLEQAKKIDRATIERFAQRPPSQKIVIYKPSIPEAWGVAAAIARRGVARTLFGNYALFDAVRSAVNPLSIGGAMTLIAAVLLWFKRRKAGFAGSCIKCGRTFCYRCKSARESATYCTQCIHIYLKRDGVALDTKRAKLEEVSEHHARMQKRNRLMATFIPGSAQLLEGRTAVGLIGAFVFLFFVITAILVGRLAPAIGPVADTAQLIVRVLAILFALVVWFVLSLPVYRRRATTVA